MHETISLIIPVYNVEPYLQRCVESVAAQTYDPLEVILVDDGSTDRSGAMCDEYAARYDRFRAYHKPNGGLGDARNYGVARASGTHIAFLDSDDWIEADYILHLYEILEQSGADIAITRLFSDDGSAGPAEGKPEGRRVPNFRIQSGPETMAEIYRHEGIGWTACGKLFRRELLLRYPFPKGYYEDCAVMYRIMCEAGKTAINEDIKDYHYIRRAGSILKSDLNEKHFRIFEICEEFQSFIQTEYPQYGRLPILLKRSSITQMLKCQKMSSGQYRQVFMKYRKEFRRNLPAILRGSGISAKSKAMFLIHCTYPFVLKASDALKPKK